MTQLSPKPGSNRNPNHNGNGRGSSFKSNHPEERNSAIHYSPSNRQLQSPLDGNTLQQPLLEMPPIPVPANYTRPRWEWGKWFSTSLRVKTTVIAILIGTLPVVSIGTVAYLTTSQQLRQQVLQKEQFDMGDMKDKIYFFIKERVGDMDSLSNMPNFKDAKVRDLLKREEKEEALNRFASTYSMYDSIAVFDLKGNLIAQSKSEPLPNHWDRDYFQQALKTDKLFITEPRRSETGEGVFLFVAAPIKDGATNQTIAIVRSRIPIKHLQEVFNINAERGQKLFVVDASGKIATAANDQLVGKKLEEVFPTLLTKITPKDLKQNEVKNIVGTSLDEQTPQEQILTYSRADRLRPLFGLDWSFVLARSAKQAFVAEEQLLWTLFLGTASATLLVGAIAAFIANRATRPIVEAAQAVEKIGQGQLDTRVDIAGEDELAILGGNINDMAGQLEVFTREQTLAAEQALLVAKVTGSRAENSKDLEDLFKDMIEETRQILNVDRVLIYRFNPDFSGYITAESVAAGFPRAFSNKAESFYLSELREGTDPEDLVIAIDNIAHTNLQADHLQLLERWRVKAKLEVPILHEGQPYGLLIAHHCKTTYEWQESEVGFLKQLAAQMGLSLDRVLLLEQTEQLAEEQRDLKEGLQKRALELLMEVDPISKGDLTIRARVTADEIGTIADSYNATVGNLRKIVTQVQNASSQVAQTTSTSEVSVRDLSVEALRQAEKIAVALKRSQDMAQSVQIVANSAKQAEVAVQQAQDTVHEGDTAMNRTVDGILAIRDTVAETAKKVKHLGESSQKISTVVNLISTFAAQTNLLALNASIEAARAGEEGRGFAVVADEVRSLAQQSAEATIEIEKLVAAIQGETNEVVAAMEAGTEQVVMGTKLVDETRQSLNKIATASSQINKLVEEIAQATVVQSQASEAVTETMTDVAAIAQKTSTGASLVSESFKELLAVAQSLQEDVGQFRVS
ncbi:methyl-accepting chemotaxis protein [Allocoleopsis franciscana]|uniref:Methyl-accepting chemotaxis protein n=1 Tax=Allocoleopsis franciscana PCC 7113 TaxID=1173027 RepID=K9WCC3_9CYAN|nr:methyl-accepting chemotaxis protein [Allocoleopsis franciscana]AFZ17147.1 methyl-accepting chemotaxis protein [Allocoleopsis franciscana PCC 7113]